MRAKWTVIACILGASCLSDSGIGSMDPSGSMAPSCSGDLADAEFGMPGKTLCAKSFGGPPDSHADIAGIFAARAGEFTLSGGFSNNIDLGGGPLSGGPRFFVSRYDAKCQYQGAWLPKLSGPAHVDAVAEDPSGNMFVVGTFEGTADFGGGPVSPRTVGASDLFVVKYAAADGAYMWARTFGLGPQIQVQAIAVDEKGDVLLTGGLPGLADFGGGVLDGRIFVAKLSGIDGGHLWSKSMGRAGWAMDVAVGKDGTLAITGLFSGDLDYGTGILQGSGKYNGGFVVAFTAAGTALWATAAGGYNVAMAADGSVAVVGDPGFPTASPRQLDKETYVTSYAPDGRFLWAQKFGSDCRNGVNGIAFEPDGDVLLSGVYTPATYKDSAPLPVTQPEAYTSFIARYKGSSGKKLGAMSLGSALSSVLVGGMVVDAEGNLALTGSLAGTVDLGSGPLTNVGLWDAFLLRIEPPPLP